MRLTLIYLRFLLTFVNFELNIIFKVVEDPLTSSIVKGTLGRIIEINC